jgi:predicted ATP-binding protein involved in virulence
MIRVYKSKWPETFFNEWVNKKDIEYSDSYISYNLEEYFHYFNNKCVFCESSSSDMKLMVGYYRPIEGALNITNGQFSEEHYRWLDKDWSNTLVLCVECHRSKSNRFPLEGDFCSLEANEFDLIKEKRLLINPFRDFPEKHFLYDEEGMIIPKTKKGEVTVEVLNLNRNSLIEGRRREFSQFNRICHTFINDKEDEKILEEIIKQIRQEAPFAGIKRYCLLRMIADDLIPYIRDFTPYLSMLNGRNPVAREDIPNKVAKEKYFNRTKKNDYYDVTDERDIQKYFSKQRFIESVEIKNFKGLNHVNIDFRLSQSKDAPWLMLLGENGIGKSSILQAISIGLMGEQKRKEVIKKNASNFIKNQKSEGFIKIYLTGMLDPIIINFKRNSHLFEGKNHVDPRVLILSYGSTRLLPTEERSNNFKLSWARVENLFDPFEPLVDVEDYLTWVKQEDFDRVKSAIEELFLEKVDITRTHDTKEIRFQFANSSVKLEDLSDGYKTIIALATDIMMVMKNRWRNYDAEGIVLIDELDAHLHPRWNIEIVRRLRKAFPKIQFIATSHNPLTLRGLLKNEVAVMFEDNDDKETLLIQDLPSQKGMRIEDILTSKFFGLYDTIPELNIYFQEYYKLLAQPSPSGEQAKRINELEDYLSEYNKLGLTKRDQLFYKAIDIYLAREKERNEEINITSFSQEIEDAINSLTRLYRK